MTQFEVLRNQYQGEPDCLFQLPAFHRLHRGDRAGGYWELFDGRQVRASVHFTDASNGLWRSPARGTFAGLWADAELGLSDQASFLREVLDALREEGASEAELLLAPEAHDQPAFARSVYLLRTLGFEIAACDLNYSLWVDERPLAERMAYGNRKRLRKCEREGLVAEALPLSALGKVYDTLAANRESKGYTLSMDFAQVEQMAALFPERVQLFGADGGETLAAAALCLRISHDVLYVFYWGDRPGYSTASPVVPLAACIYNWCQREGIAVLDVGTSTIDREPNHGLIQFKRGLGFSESLKLRMTTTL